MDQLVQQRIHELEPVFNGFVGHSDLEPPTVDLTHAIALVTLDEDAAAYHLDHAFYGEWSHHFVRPFSEFFSLVIRSRSPAHISMSR